METWLVNIQWPTDFISPCVILFSLSLCPFLPQSVLLVFLHCWRSLGHSLISHMMTDSTSAPDALETFSSVCESDSQATGLPLLHKPNQWPCVGVFWNKQAKHWPAISPFLIITRSVLSCAGSFTKDIGHELMKELLGILHFRESLGICQVWMGKALHFIEKMACRNYNH